MAVTLGIGTLASPAAAEPSGTVSFAVVPGTVVQGQPVAITASGTSSQAGELAIYYTDGSAPSCLSVKSIRETPANPAYSPSTPVPAGSYSQTYSFTPTLSGTYAVCGYLYDPSSSTDAIYAAGTGSFNATVQPPPIPPGCTDPACTEPPPPPLPPPPHLTALTVKVRSHTGSTAAKPGHTELLVRATGDAVVLVVLKRQGRTRKTEFSYASSDKLDVPWTCSRPGGVYSFTVTAIHDGDKTLTSRGKFRPVSAARCRALHAADARRRREEAAAERRERSRERREEHEPPRFGPDQEEREQTETKEDQDNLCKTGLGGSGHVVEQEVNPEPGSGRGVRTVCEVVVRSGARYTYYLSSDHPIIVKGGRTE
jgi:hypothetical protein